MTLIGSREGASLKTFMAKILPNEKCPCGYELKFKKCCKTYLEGKMAEDANRLARVCYVAMIAGDYAFLWDTLHPESPRKKHDSREKFLSDQKLLKNLDYKRLILLDEKTPSPVESILVSYVIVSDGGQDLSYLEESTWKKSGERWFYFDGLRKSSVRLGCEPKSIRVGDLPRLFMHKSKLS